MVDYLLKFKNLLRIVSVINIEWRPPRQSDILIYDSTGQEYLIKYLSPWCPEILHVRREKINIFVLMLSFFQRGRLNIRYIDAYIKRVNPRLIVTFIDNNKLFYKISRRHPEIKTIFVQNGYRGYYADVFELLDKENLNERGLFHVDYMMTLGHVIGKEYGSHISGYQVPMGSLKSNSLMKKQPMVSGVISFISQWYQGGFYIGDLFYSHEDYSKEVDRLVIKSITEFASDNNKQFFIIPRYDKSEDLRREEELYFRDIVGEEVNFLEPKVNLSSYQATDISEVVVTADSTLGYESLARGNKTAFFSIRSNILNIQGFSYGWPKKFPDDGLFWTNNPNKTSFIQILDYLFTVNDVKWKEDILESGFSSVMTNDPGNEIFKSIIEKELGLTPISE